MVYSANVIALSSAARLQKTNAQTEGASMTKKHFIALADSIREHNRCSQNKSQNTPFTPDQLETLARFCASQNGRFNRSRWLAYVAGECGPNGGEIKKPACNGKDAR
jgi:hypothetical protein